MQGTESRSRVGTRRPLLGGNYMDAGTITQLIGSLGFPIAACIALFWQNSKMAERHSEELKQITEALNNNTLAITELSAKIGGMA